MFIFRMLAAKHFWYRIDQIVRYFTFAQHSITLNSRGMRPRRPLDSGLAGYSCSFVRFSFSRMSLKPSLRRN